MATLVPNTLTIHYPYNYCPDTRVRGVGKFIPFCDVPDGALFRMIAQPTRVYEKLPPNLCACLVPWECEIYDLGMDVLCERMEEIK